jgi:hypothetical protein
MITAVSAMPLQRMRGDCCGTLEPHVQVSHYSCTEWLLVLCMCNLSGLLLECRVLSEFAHFDYCECTGKHVYVGVVVCELKMAYHEIKWLVTAGSLPAIVHSCSVGSCRVIAPTDPLRSACA